MTAHSTSLHTRANLLETVGNVHIDADAPTALVELRSEPASSLGHAATIALREAEAMRLDITHLLYAIDRGYFGEDNCIKRSEFIACLRKYATHDFRPITQERAA